jgi:hypothetical protein
MRGVPTRYVRQQDERMRVEETTPAVLKWFQCGPRELYMLKNSELCGLGLHGSMKHGSGKHPSTKPNHRSRIATFGS